MSIDNQSFPVFKRYRHGNTWLRFDNAETMTEVRVLGQSYNVLTINARILPERVMIADLLQDASGALEIVTPQAFHDFLEDCRQHKTLREF